MPPMYCWPWGEIAARNALCTLRFSFDRANHSGDGIEAA